MGFYINTGSHNFKAEALLRRGARLEREPFFDGSGARVGICVVWNGIFEAAGIAFSAAECAAFNRPEDSRPKQWLSLDRALCIELCPEVATELPALTANSA